MTRLPRAALARAITAFAFGVLALLAAPSPSYAATCYKYLSQKDYPGCLQLDSELVLHYRTVVDGDGVEQLELAPDGDGYMSWIALGISEVGMKGVDFNIVIRGTEGFNWVMGDYFTTNYSMPLLDEEQNAVLTASPDFDKNNHTLPVWQRPLDSCDAEDTPVFRDVERTIIWAYNYRSIWDTDKFYFRNHTRGMISGVRLAPSAANPSTNTTANSTTSISTPPTTAAAELSKVMSVSMPSYPVPNMNSSVACVNLQLPNDTAYHVTAYHGFNTTPYVHHMVGYVCGAGVTPAVAPGTIYPCGGGQTALPVGCETVNYVWTPGAGGFVAPPQAGFAMGAGAATTLVLQVHYQNAPGAVGKVDYSGFNLTYTSALRNSTLGVLTLGNTDLRIPAATERYTALPNICPASCTGKRVRAPVTLVSNFYMMGRLGVSSLTRHIRDGAAIQPVGRINYWDYGRNLYQTAFPDSKMLLPNDTLISLCSYNSSAIARSMTFYGLNPWQETCFNYVTFFPVSAMPDLDYCVADTRKNYTTCGTRTQLARMAATGANDTVQLRNGTLMPVGTLNISPYKSAQCELHDQTDVTPRRQPNTRAAVASTLLTIIVLSIIGFIIYSKYSKLEEAEHLLAKARERGLESVLAEEDAIDEAAYRGRS